MLARRPILVLVVVALVSAALGYAVKPVINRWRASQTAWQFAAHPETRSRYRLRMSLFAHLDSRPTVVMLGDSITQLAEWPELLGPGVANRGIGGDTSRALLGRLDASVPDSARTVVIMIGLNDLKGKDWTPEASAANLAAIARRLKGRRIIVQSVLFTADDAINGKIVRLNRAYADLCQTGACEWLDLNPRVLPTGRLAGADSSDGRHVMGPVYARWAGVLKPRLAAELKGGPATSRPEQTSE